MSAIFYEFHVDVILLGIDESFRERSRSDLVRMSRSSTFRIFNFDYLSKSESRDDFRGCFVPHFQIISKKWKNSEKKGYIFRKSGTFLLRSQKIFETSIAE